MQHLKRPFKRHMLWSGSILLLLVILAACGGGTNTASSTASGFANNASKPQMANNAAAANTQAGTNTAKQQEKSNKFIGPQYLIKSLKVSMQVKDTRKVANDLQSWVSTTDPRATSSGMDYQQTSDDLYNITMTISVQASAYPAIQQYLGSYPSLHGGQLLGMTETVQDVTGTYVDTQSRLKTLHIEQARLQDLMSKAQNLTDLLALEQRLTDVEGQIESTQAQLNTLTNRVTFYPITIAIQPVQSATPPPPPPPGWSAGQVFHDALASAIGFGQGLLSILIWLLAFSIYIIPVLAIIWFIRRWRTQLQFAPRPKMPSFASFTPAAPSITRHDQKDATADSSKEASTASTEDESVASPK